jgi:hypothetical protein
MEHNTLAARLAEAKNPKTSPNRLEQLASDPDEEARYHVAKNSHTPRKRLPQLACDPSAPVRRAVAQHLCTPLAVFQQLADGPDEEVRCNVARNPNTTLDVLAVLVLDSESKVQQAALKAFQKSNEKHDMRAGRELCFQSNSGVSSESIRGVSR